MTYHLSPQNSSRCWTITDYSTKLSGKRTTLTAEFAKHGKKLRQLASLPASGPPAISAPMTNPTARPATSADFDPRPRPAWMLAPWAGKELPALKAWEKRPV